MIKELSIKNFGLIDEHTLIFETGLNILTGETGAGKSIIIGALRCVLGEKMQVAQLKDNRKPAIIEAIFELDPSYQQRPEFKEWLELSDSIIIQRTFNPEGRSRIKINGLTSTAQQLKQLGQHLIDLHGPHDHQMLLSNHTHIECLDRLTRFDGLLETYRDVYDRYLRIQRDITRLEAIHTSRDREIDILRHQVNELDQYELDDKMYQKICTDRSRLNNTEKLVSTSRQLLEFIEGGEYGVSENIRQAFQSMRTLNSLDDSTQSFMDNLTQFQEINDQMIRDLNQYIAELTFDPTIAEDINRQFDAYEEIIRKYGPDMKTINEFYDEARQRLDQLENWDVNIKNLQDELNVCQEEMTHIADQISTKRYASADTLRATIERELIDLGMPHVQFECRIEEKDWHPTGRDNATFFISPNAGEPLKPLSEIISSGEAARVMLALKRALIEVDPVPVLIFDEIDAQIGGRLGSVIGHKLKDISTRRQIILITHLPQIASFADTHFKITKTVKKQKTFTTVQVLNRDNRIDELAAMMSGEEEHSLSRQQADDMLIRAGQ